ncbi:MAG: glycerol-3-phosphate acyltransferase, partial [Defluviitaleaceae bacterium]|nr:glycerol-3-phosphate acyltransferase [Defluviitaleaceae bacterium]
MFRIVCLLIGYAFGMLQTSYIVGKISGIDIREHGSKNAGFTNTNRVLGIKKGAVVFVVDVLKAVAAFVVATLLAQSVGIYAGGTFFYSTNVLPG